MHCGAAVLLRFLVVLHRSLLHADALCARSPLSPVFFFLLFFCSTSSRLVESLSEELLLRLTVELSKHTSRIARGSEAEAKLLAAQAKACGNKASIHQVRALWESLMVAQTKAKATTTTSRSPAPVKRSHIKKTHK